MSDDGSAEKISRYAGEAMQGAAEQGQPYIDIDTPKYRGDIIAAAVCLGFALAVYFLIIPAHIYVPKAFIGTANSPAFLPKMICIVLAILSAIYLANSVLSFRRETPQGRSRASDWGIAGAMIGICMIYVGGILVLGMTIATGLCVAGTIYFFGERRYGLIAGIAILLPAILWYFFVEVAHILLPTPELQILGGTAAIEAAIAWAGPVIQAGGLA
ncbi:MAG: tripartite tricarboxylate transporter TctB family protein [Rhodospirillales bacterium]